MYELENWLANNPEVLNVLKYGALLAIVLFVISKLRNYLKQRPLHKVAKYKAQKGIEVIGYLLIILITISFVTGNLQNFGLALGLLTAGITITLQELILSVAGFFYIFLVKVYRPGDRIEINGIKGDVIDIDSIYTTMMEIGQWVSSDNYSGRIVKLSNSFVFKGAVYNYSQDFPFVWDEFNLPIRYGSDMDLAREIVISTAQEVLADYVTQSTDTWEAIVSKYYIEDAEVNPTLATSLTDNWVQYNLRYIVDYKKRRHTKHLLNEAIGKKIMATEGKVVLASATYEIVEMPAINLNMDKVNVENPTHKT